jgi:hypothetical protein
VGRAADHAVHPDVLRSALVEAVDSGRYWQEPDDTDGWLATVPAASLLRPVAEVLADTSSAAWWWDRVDPATQTVVHWADGPATLPPRSDAAEAEAWSAASLAEELRAERDLPANPAAPVSGSWWSAPCSSTLPHSARRSAEGVPAGLCLVEDEMGWPAARTWPLRVRPGARVLEIHDAAGWTDLVARHPLPATASRRHDWFRCTGRTGEWLLPDWGSVAAEVDAVHVSVAAWLGTAGRAVDVPGTTAATVLAGWDPDATWWLTDVVESGHPTDWVRTEEDPPNRWRPQP